MVMIDSDSKLKSGDEDDGIEDCITNFDKQIANQSLW